MNTAKFIRNTRLFLILVVISPFILIPYTYAVISYSTRISTMDDLMMIMMFGSVFVYMIFGTGTLFLILTLYDSRDMPLRSKLELLRFIFSPDFPSKLE